MSALHQLIEMQGKQEALQRWEHRAPVEAAAAFMADEDRGTGYLYSGLCQAALPHRRLANTSDGWQIRSDYLSICL